MKTRFIGDVHGKFKAYQKIISSCWSSIQVGDFGLGFGALNEPKKLPEGHYAIRGNHDNPEVANKHPSFLGGGEYFNDMMFIGGAYSINYMFRTPGFDWWPDEELSESRLEQIEKNCAMLQPSIMVTHECPLQVAKHLFEGTPALSGGRNAKLYPTRTSVSLQRILDAHRPKLWVFGHYHASRDEVIEGCRFICLAELEYKDIDLADYR